MEAWEDGDCPWCRSLLDPGLVPAGADAAGRQARPATAGPTSGPRRSPPAWTERARLLMVPVAALTVLAALVVALA
ncbi:hypothetical protein [Streptomyces sp. NPDC004065]|uniref:hypothetical protein n=1 Tax=Streptomyces sp. NPDC004065 TaxID=3364689 RepID=UPI0038508B75